MQVFRKKIPAAAYIFLGVYAVVSCLMIYSALSYTPKVSVYRANIALMPWAISLIYTIYLIRWLIINKVVFFGNHFRNERQDVPFSDIRSINIEDDKIVIHHRNTDQLLNLPAKQFSTKVWRQLSEKMMEVESEINNRKQTF